MILVTACFSGTCSAIGNLLVSCDFSLVNEIKSSQENSYRQLTGSINTNRNNIVGISFKLNPSATVRDNCSIEQGLTRGIHGDTIVSTWGTYQLAYDNTLCTIDNKGTGVSHQREVTHEDFAVMELTIFLVNTTNFYTKRCRIGCISFLALLQAVFWLAQRVIQQS